MTLMVKGTWASELRTRFCPIRFTYSVTTGSLTILELDSIIMEYCLPMRISVSSEYQSPKPRPPTLRLPMASTSSFPPSCFTLLGSGSATGGGGVCAGVWAELLAAPGWAVGALWPLAGVLWPLWGAPVETVWLVGLCVWVFCVWAKDALALKTTRAALITTRRSFITDSLCCAGQAVVVIIRRRDNAPESRTQAEPGRLSGWACLL